MQTPEIYLIDGSAYIYRAYHAIRELSNSSGVPTNAVFGFVSILKKLIKTKKPKYIAVAFDSKGPVFRHDMYSAYKANRPPMPEDLVPQIQYIRDCVEAYGIVSMIQSGQEADDLIASSTEKMAKQGCKVIIVSGDKDLLQLVSEDVALWDPMNDRFMDEVAVEKKYGLVASQLLDYFALTGDSADNIPGVPGVGPKTAQKLIDEHKTLEKLYESTDTLKKSKMKERIIEHKDDAFLSRDLIRLNLEADVPEALSGYSLGQPNNEKLRALFTELEFHSLLKEDVQSAKLATDNFHLVQTEDALAGLSERLMASGNVVIDTETDSLNPFEAVIAGISVCMDDSEAWYIPCGHVDAHGDLQSGQLEWELIRSYLRPVFENTKIVKIGHNLKYDYSVLNSPINGAVDIFGPLHDTMIGAWLMDPGRRSYKLDVLCGEIDIQMTPFSEVVGGDKSSDAFKKVELVAAKNYSCEDVIGAWKLFELQRAKLAEWNLLDLLRGVEGEFIKVLVKMERTGVLVNRLALEELSEEFGHQLLGFEQSIYSAAGKEFNIQSPKQLGEVLFEDLQLPKGRKTKTGWSTDVKVLEKLAGSHELPALVVQYRNIAKLKSTYVDKLKVLCDKKTDRVHTSYHQCGTATGRLSSSNPNLQNIPIRTAEGQRIRSAFVAPAGNYLLSGDYSQIDLRVLAHYSSDEVLVEAFQNGEDIHQQTASQIFFVAPVLVTAEMRRVAKTINFGIVYGMSSFGLASQLNVSRKEAQTFIDRYFSHFAGIKNFMGQLVEEAGENGYVTTLAGRRRFLPDLQSKNRTRREFAERMAINTPIQGSAADIMKIAMLKVDNELENRGFESRVILQIHDELVLEVPESELEGVSSLLKGTMESAVNLAVPLTVNIHHSQNLGKV